MVADDLEAESEARAAQLDEVFEAAAEAGRFSRDDMSSARAGARVVFDVDALHRERFEASRRATAAVRALAELLRDRDLSDDDFDVVAERLGHLNDELSGRERSPRWSAEGSDGLGGAFLTDRYEYGVNGRSTVARPDVWTAMVLDPETDSGNALVGGVRFGPINEGTLAGTVTGPWIAYVLDVVSIQTAAYSFGTSSVKWKGGLTRDLAIRYRRPTPIGVDLAIRSWVSDFDGRRFNVSTEINQDEELLAVGQATMVALL